MSSMSESLLSISSVLFVGCREDKDNVSHNKTYSMT